MKELVIEAKTENLDAVLMFIDEELEKLDCPIKTQMQIDIAVEEIFVNIAHYAYTPGVGNATIRLGYEEETNAVCMTFIDSGMPYDPLAKEDPDITLSAEERQIGGLGIFMVKNSMEDMNYVYEDGKNILSMKKKLF